MRTATATRSPCHGSASRSCESSLLAGPFDVDDTARTKLRMTRIDADVATQMPAAHTLGLRARFHLDPHALRVRLHRIDGRRIDFNDPRLARDQQETQFVPQCL